VSARGGVLVAGLVLAAGAACDVPPETTAMAHESPPWDAPVDGPWPIDGPPMATFRMSSFFGGAADDEIAAAVVTGGPNPEVIIVGGTSSSDFTTTDGSQVDTSASAGCSACPYDAFVTKLRSPGMVVWSRVIGGPGFERAAAVALAQNGDVFVGGSAASLPVTGTPDATFAGGSTAERGDEDGFVCRLDGATGDTEWCTFVGGSGSGGVQALVADWSTNSLLVAFTTSAAEALHADPDYRAAFAGRHRSTAAGADTVVLRMADNGQNFTWATYVGGSGDESGAPSIALTAQGVHVLTTTSSTDAPTLGGYLTSAPAGRNAYLATLSSDGTTLVHGTYLGGGGDDWTPPHGLVSRDGIPSLAAVVNTTSADMPTRGAPQPTYGGGGSAGCGDGDGWAGWIEPLYTGDESLRAATYIGGSRGDEIGGFATLRDGRWIVIGRTYSSDFPVEAPILPFQAMLGGAPCTSAPGNADGFLVELRQFQRDVQREMATYVGGAAADGFLAAAAASDSTFHVIVGQSASSDFPTRAPFQDRPLRGASDAVIVTPEIWPWMPVPPEVDARVDAPPGGLDGGLDGGSGVDGGGGGCCGASRAPATSSIVLALALLALVTSRGRRGAGGTASARGRGAP